jgi:hypothetical protein
MHLLKTIQMARAAAKVLLATFNAANTIDAKLKKGIH